MRFMTNKRIILLVVVIVGGIFLAVAIPFSILLYFAFEEQIDKDDFLANGKRGKAKILKIEDKTRYTSRGSFPRAKLLLEVSVPNFPIYQTETTEDIPAIHAPRVQIGSTIDVWVDPEQPNSERRILLLLEEDTLEKEKTRR